MKIVDFIKVFAWPEFVELIKNKRKILFLCLMVFLSFIVVGFSNAIKKQLEEKMIDPFVSFVNVVANFSLNSTELDQIKHTLDDQNIATKFGYKACTSIYLNECSFFSLKGKLIDTKIRAVEKNDAFYQKLVHSNKILITPNFVDITSKNLEFGVIVTKSFLENLNYSKLENVSYIEYSPSVGISTKIPVAAIVTELPDYVDVLVSKEFFSCVRGSAGEVNVLSDTNTNQKELIVFFKTNNIRKAREKINSIFDKNQIEELPNETFANGIRIKFKEKKYVDYNEIKQLFNSTDFEMIQVNNFGDHVDMSNLITNFNTIKEDFLVIEFKDLDKVESFNTFLHDSIPKVRLDMNTVEAKSNFDFFDKISNMLIIILIFFSVILMVILMLSNIIGHIEKNKQNLGTLKAFGLSDWYITFVYASISFVLIVLIISSSFFVAKLSGTFITELITKNITKIKLDEKLSPFQLDFSFLLFVFYFVIPIIIIPFNIFMKIHNKTPGELIYDRD